ncbi:cellulose-binding family ii [Fusarium subglutinans]|uniref:Cellulose-binding family ii n=1 Tax=Gibberella subglutinans TaxID=42677 RepID=A0A8H5PC58_GIBSU|nr:cellulose-binding family ii [Fusarium subglutinans]KAF5594056.1 cellulose-binding family ii [Fusarium subglutinans]
MLSRTSTAAFSMVAIFRLAICAFVDSPNDPIPDQWKQSLPMAWDNTEIMMSAIFPDNGGLSKYHNWAIDQIMDGNGTINVCMNWISDSILDEETRKDVSIQHVKQYQQWFEWLPGWDNFPFKEVKFKIIAWAIANDSQLIGNRDGFHVYTEFKDKDGIIACDPGCSRHLHPDGDYSSCGRGAENRFHQYFFVDKSWGEFNMGAASGEGINVSEYGWDTVGSKMGKWSILVHETLEAEAITAVPEFSATSLHMSRKISVDPWMKKISISWNPWLSMVHKLTGSVLKITLGSDNAQTNFAYHRGFMDAEAYYVTCVTSNTIVNHSKASSNTGWNLGC